MFYLFLSNAIASDLTASISASAIISLCYLLADSHSLLPLASLSRFTYSSCSFSRPNCPSNCPISYIRVTTS
jgi:hypothetical protein